MGNLQQDTDAVSSFSFCVFSCTMFQIFYNLQCLADNLVAFLSVDIYHCADPTVVMLQLRTV